MVGVARLNNIEMLVHNVIDRGIPGDFIETGVWRGGASMFARGVMRALGDGSRRVFVCDSFQGLPPGDRWAGLLTTSSTSTATTTTTTTAATTTTTTTTTAAAAAD